jgi:hypothetical protein
MHGLLRTATMALLVTMMAAALPDAHSLQVPAAQTEHPAGCHERGPAAPPRSPSPSPTSYQCCVSGHHAAIPNGAFSLRSTAAQLCLLHDGEDRELEFVPRHDPSGAIVYSYSPPGTSPLRI